MGDPLHLDALEPHRLPERGGGVRGAGVAGQQLGVLQAAGDQLAGQAMRHALPAPVRSDVEPAHAQRSRHVRAAGDAADADDLVTGQRGQERLARPVEALGSVPPPLDHRRDDPDAFTVRVP